MRKIQGCIIGNNSTASAESLKTAYQTGSLFAELGITLICGGRSGIMEAACKGALSQNGITVGILPDDSLENANPYCSIVIPTGIGYARNMVNVLSGDFTVAIGGGSGTLSEMSYAWQFGRKIYAFTLFDGWAKELAGKKIDDKYPWTIIPVNSVDDLKGKLQREYGL